MKTKRPLNECKECGYTWHPRGHDVSKSCPSCGGDEIDKEWDWEVIIWVSVFLLIFGIGVFPYVWPYCLIGGVVYLIYSRMREDV